MRNTGKAERWLVSTFTASALAMGVGGCGGAGVEVEQADSVVEQQADDNVVSDEPESNSDSDGSPEQTTVILGDVDRDGEDDYAIIINGGNGGSDGNNEVNLLGEGQPSTTPPSTIELFGLDGIMPPPEPYVLPTPGFSFEAVISEIAAGTYEYDVALGYWEGLVIVPDDVGISVFNEPVYFEDAEYGDAYFGTAFEYGQDGELSYSPNGFRVGTFPEGQPGSVAVFTPEDHLFVGGDGKTASSNRVHIANPEAVSATGSIEDIEFVDNNGDEVTPTVTTYSLDEMDDLLAAVEAGGYDTFRHKFGEPAGVITSQDPN